MPSDRHLHAVDPGTGEVFETCPGCEEREREIQGLQGTIRSQAGKIRALQVDAEVRAQEDALWPRGVRLFDYWRTETGHLNSQWGAPRFELCRPSLVRYDDVVLERAVAGIAYNPHTDTARNGREIRYDAWETLFKKTGNIEWYANKAPGGWVPPRLRVDEISRRVGRFLLDRAALLEKAEDGAAVARTLADVYRQVEEWRIGGMYA